MKWRKESDSPLYTLEEARTPVLGEQCRESGYHRFTVEKEPDTI